jgi:hypothetical protein
MARKSRRTYTPRILGSGKIMTPADLNPHSPDEVASFGTACTIQI